MFNKNSVLGTGSDGEANGKRVLTKWTAELAAREVAGKWKGLKGDALDDFIKEKFGGAWHNIDTTNKGTLDMKSAYSWIRTFIGDDLTAY